MEKEEIQGSGFMQIMQKLDRHRFMLSILPVDLPSNKTIIRVTNTTYPKRSTQQEVYTDQLYFGTFMEIVERNIEALCNGVFRQEPLPMPDFEMGGEPKWQLGDTFYYVIVCGDDKYEIGKKEIKAVLLREGMADLYDNTLNRFDVTLAQNTDNMFRTPEEVADVIRVKILDNFNKGDNYPIPKSKKKKPYTPDEDEDEG